MRNDAQAIIKKILSDNMPGAAVKNALAAYDFAGTVQVVAIGKAAWTMAEAAVDFLGEKITRGIIVTKYGHSQGPLPRFEIHEAGHPTLDENTLAATARCIELAKSLTEKDELLFLVSGGGSALFEKPLDGVSLEDLQSITQQLLASGADIVEINKIRKRLSAVKAGRFAQLAAPARVYAVILSDVLGDKPDAIASGPAVPDTSTVAEALAVVDKYKIHLTEAQRAYLQQETPKEIHNVTTAITGSVRTLCKAAAKAAAALGYTPHILTTTLNCEAAEAGRFLSAIATSTKQGETAFTPPCAIIAGGETVVTLTGKGKGGRNQELALSATRGIKGLENVLLFSLGSDGTDGPTDAAGGIVTNETTRLLKEKNINIDKALADNDAYNALAAADGLVITGPTGTNVNDVTVILCK